jgi:hypothetical protein
LARAAVYRGGRPAARQTCCPEPALLSVRGSRSAQVRPSEQAHPVVPALRAQASVSRWEPASGDLEELLREAAPAASEPGVRRTVPEAAPCAAVLRVAAWSARVAAEPPREAVPTAWEPRAGRAVPEAVVSGRAAAAPQPAAAKAASGRAAATVASERPGAAEAPDGPQVEAEAVAALSDAAVRLPTGARRADGAVQPRAVVLPGARVLQAEPLSAVPSAAASVFRQGRSLEAGPARPRAAKRPAHAMRCLPIASRSEPSSQAARNEGWSWC